MESGIEFRSVALPYFKAIENEWNIAYRRWSNRYGKPQIDINKAITGVVDNRWTQEFIDARPNPAFLQNRQTCKIMQRLKKLRNKEAHPYEVEAQEIVKMIQSLWQDDFLQKYFQALVPRA